MREPVVSAPWISPSPGVMQSPMVILISRREKRSELFLPYLSFSVEVSIDRCHYCFILFFHDYGSSLAWCGNVSDRVVCAIFSPFELP